MLNIDSLHTMAMLIDLGERDQAKELAEGILGTAEKSELQIIKQCADILDTNKPNVAKAKLDLFARELDNEHRTHSSGLVRFCMDHTGARVRRSPDEAPTSLSVFTDSRPGYAEDDAQPSGLENPTPWEIKRAQHLAQLTHQLRDYWKDLPAHVRTALRTVKTRPMPDNSHPDDFQILDEYPGGRETYRALRRRRMSHTLAFALATTPEAPRKAILSAKQKADDYARTRLGVEDHTAPHGVRVTIFDIDDHHAEKARYRSIRCQLCQHVRDDADTATRRDDGLCRECRHVMNTFRATPCVFCWVERTYDDHRGTAHAFGHAHGHDDGLCGECREKSRPGLRPVQATTRRMRTVAYLHPEDRAAAAEHAAITARCASVADHLSPALALKWLRAYYCVAPEAHRPAIEGWVSEWRNGHRPQSPTPVTPAARPSAAPVPALVAA